MARTDARRPWLAAAAIVALALVAYVPVWRAGFVWDDVALVTGNPLVHAADGLRRLWLSREAVDYFPLAYSTFWIEWRLWGANAVPYHVTNVLLHALSAVLLWRVLDRLRVPGAWFAGLIFAVHPLAVGSVAWISERKNTISMALYLLTFLAWLRFEDGGRRRWSVAALALFLAALFAKTSVVTLPLVLLLVAWWRRGRVTRRDVARTLPFFAASLALGIVTLWFHHAHAVAGVAVRPEGTLSRIAASGWIACFYLAKTLLPLRLAIVYPRWTVDGADPLAFVPLALLVLALGLSWGLRRRGGRGSFFALAYFLVTAAPVLGFVDMAFMRVTFVADHLAYVPMIGVIALIAGALSTAASRLGWRPAARSAAAAALLAVLAVLTFRQSAHYRDPIALWTHAVAVNDRAWIAYNNLGLALAEAGRPDVALRDYDRAIVLAPDDAEAHYNRGNACVALGRPDQAVRDYGRAIALRPGYDQAYNNRGNALRALGRCDLAVRDYDRAIALRPDFAMAYNNRGACRLALGRLDDAILDFDRTIALRPDLAGAYNNRALAHHRLGDDARAWEDVAACRRAGGSVSPALIGALSPRTEADSTNAHRP